MTASSLIGALAIPAAVVGALTFFLMAVFSQESKTLSRTTLVRSAFVHVIAFVSLAMLVGSVIYMGQEGLRVSVWPKAQTPYYYSEQPPSLFFSNSKLNSPESTALKCETACEFTDADKAQITTWRDAYTNWKANSTGSWSIERKRGIVDALSMFIVGGGLFIWFFIFIAQRENKKLRPILGRPIALRTVYYYLVALVSLLAAIIAATLLVNIALKSAFHLENTKSTITAPIYAGGTEKTSVQSIINCGNKCGISAGNQSLAKQWLVDYDSWISKGGGKPNNNSAQTDLANYLPILIISAPLFWYHFARIRREGQESESTGNSPTK